MGLAMHSTGGQGPCPINTAQKRGGKHMVSVSSLELRTPEGTNKAIEASCYSWIASGYDGTGKVDP